MKYTCPILLILVIQLLTTAIASAQDKTSDDYVKSASLLQQKGDIEGAVADFTKAIELNKDNLNAYFKRGFAQTVQKNYDAAVLDFSVVLQSHPDHLWAYISRGSAYNKIGRYQDGLNDFNKALQIDPENQEAYNNRGWSKKYLGDTKGACEDWSQSKKLGNGEAKLILKTSGCK